MNNFFTKDELLKARTARSFTAATESFSSIYESIADSKYKKFDYFISHSIRDKEYVEGLYKILTQQGKRVYVDWIVDKALDREQVNENTALILRQRMDHSNVLLYAISENASQSKWMPWELGYFDAKKNKQSVKILPITDYAWDSFTDQEFTKIYDKIDKDYFKKNIY